MTINFDSNIRAAIPHFRMLLVTADVTNGPTNDSLWDELEQLAIEIRTKYEIPDINRRPAIAATRAAYKACGKDPNRYRPSSEALCRRIVKGMELYRTLSVIDLINLISIKTGHSIGGFDADKIQGDTLTLGVGREEEPYIGIGRGPLNISGLPVYRDTIGGIGTPTSDNERTKLDPSTTRLLMTINMYDTASNISEVISTTQRLLSDYADASNIKISEFSF